MIYTFDSRVRYSEVDHQGTLTLPALMNYLQDCSTFQSEDIGVGLSVLRERKRAWLLSYWQVEVRRYPKLGERITVGTLATGFKGFFGNRNFYIDDENGDRLACANSIWVFMDAEAGRPVKPGEEEIAPYGLEEPLEMDYEGRKIRLPETAQALEPFPVRRAHIDTNEHVNNSQYIQMVMDLLPGDFPVHRLRVDYKKSAVMGDSIFPKLSREEGRTVAELCDDTGRAYVVAELK